MRTFPDVERLDILPSRYSLPNVRFRQVQHPQDAIGRTRDRLDPVKRLAADRREIGQTAQLGKGVGEVLPVGIDNGDIDVLAFAVEEEEVGAHPAPVALGVPVGDGEGIAGRTRGVSIPGSESIAAHLPVENIDLPPVQGVDGEVALRVGHEVPGAGLKLAAVFVLGLLGANPGPLDFRRLDLGRHAPDLVVDGAALVRQPLDRDPVVIEPLTAEPVGLQIEFVRYPFDLGQRGHLYVRVEQPIFVFVVLREVVRVLPREVRGDYPTSGPEVGLDGEFIGRLNKDASSLTSPPTTRTTRVSPSTWSIPLLASATFFLCCANRPSSVPNSTR